MCLSNGFLTMYQSDGMPAVAERFCRRDLVLAAASSDELLEVLEDLSQVRVVPLLQALLFDS